MRQDKRVYGTRHPLFAPNYVSPLVAATPERREHKVLKQEAAAMLTAADIKRRYASAFHIYLAVVSKDKACLKKDKAYLKKDKAYLKKSKLEYSVVTDMLCLEGLADKLLCGQKLTSY